MQHHLNNIKEPTEQFAEIGAPMGEEDQVVSLLGSLPKRYEALVTALVARVDDISLDFVQQTLIQEEQKYSGETGANESKSVFIEKS